MCALFAVVSYRTDVKFPAQAEPEPDVPAKEDADLKQVLPTSPPAPPTQSPLQVTATVFLGLECRADVLLQVLQ